MISVRNLVRQIDIRIHTYVLGPSDTRILSSPTATTATGTYLVVVARTTDNGRLALAQHDIGKEVGIVAEVIRHELIIISKPQTVIGH